MAAQTLHGLPEHFIPRSLVFCSITDGLGRRYFLLCGNPHRAKCSALSDMRLRIYLTRQMLRRAVDLSQ